MCKLTNNKLKLVLTTVAFVLTIACTSTQEAEDIPTGISLDVEELSFTENENSQTVTVTSGSKWIVASKPEWLTVNSIESSYAFMYEWPVSLVVSSNDGYNRKGEIAFQAGEITATLPVSQEGKKGEYVAVESVSVSPTELTMTEGDTQTLTATVLPSNASENTVTWSSSNESVTTVSSKGVVSAKAVGTAVITVKTDDKDKTATCRITVKAKTIPVTGVSLDKTSLSMTVGDTQALTATVTPSNATDKSVEWSSDNKDVAVVVLTSEGRAVYAQSPGTATITVKTNDGGKTATCKVTVNAKEVSVTGVSLNINGLTLTKGYTYSLKPTITPSNATNQSVTWSSSNTSVATVSSSGVITAKAGGFTTITVKTNDGSKTATCSVSVVDYNGYEYVDLGLPSGLKWATCNVGASQPEEYGDYFAWGETTPKDDYSWKTYRWCKGSDSTLTKYCNNSSYGNNGFTDTKTVLDLEDDAANVILGGSWRIPTDAEWSELMDNCTSVWTQENGVNGRKVISNKNGNSIFLPVAGYRSGRSKTDPGIYGYYCTSTLASYPSVARGVGIGSGGVGRQRYERYYGLSVRPVSE